MINVRVDFNFQNAHSWYLNSNEWKKLRYFCLMLREVHHDGVWLHPLTKPDVVGPGLGVWIWLELG